MARQEVNYNPGQERTKVTAEANVLTKKAEEANPRSSLGFQLAEALSVNSKQIQQVIENNNKSEEEDAQRYVRSMTIDELGNKIKAGEVLPSQSPVFAAKVQKMHGENLSRQYTEDVKSKIARGEISFASSQEMDQYLTKLREENLQGYGGFTRVGFDQHWEKTRGELSEINSRLQDKKYVEQGFNTFLDYTKKRYEDFSNDPKVTKQQIIDDYIQEYSINRKAGVGVLGLPGVGRKALLDMAEFMAGRKDVEGLSLFLNTKLDNGQDISTVLGSAHANHIWQTTLRQLEIAQKKQQTQQIHALAEAKRQENIGIVTRSLGNGSFFAVPTLTKVNKTTGEVETLSPSEQEDIAREAIERTASSKNLSVEQRALLYSSNDIGDNDIKRRVGGVLSGIASLAQQYDGKPLGELGAPVKESIKYYIQYANAIQNPSYLRKTLGDKTFEKMEDMRVLVTEASDAKGGVDDSRLTRAADVVFRGDTLNISDDIKGKQLKLLSEFTHRLTNGDAGFIMRMASKFNFSYNTIPNFEVVQKDMSRLVGLKMRMGVPYEEAVKETFDFLADPANSTVINGTLYRRHQLPPVKEGYLVEDMVQKWLEPARDSASKSGLDRKRVVFNILPGGRYAASMIGGMPLYVNGKPYEITKEQWKAWMEAQDAEARDKATVAGQEAYSIKAVGKKVVKGIKTSGDTAPEALTGVQQEWNSGKERVNDTSYDNKNTDTVVEGVMGNIIPE